MLLYSPSHISGAVLCMHLKGITFDARNYSACWWKYYPGGAHLKSTVNIFSMAYTKKFSEKSEMKEGKKANIHFLNNDLVSGRIIVYSLGFF